MGIKLSNKLPNKIKEVKKWVSLKENWDPTYYNIHFTLQMNICHVKLAEYDIWVWFVFMNCICIVW
jgi:hypothetical protein